MSVRPDDPTQPGSIPAQGRASTPPKATAVSQGMTRWNLEGATGSLPTWAAPAYALQRLLGTGGMGEVWEAIQGSLGRRVAVKRVRTDAGPGVHAHVRFVQEAVITAALDHPNIVPVYDLGFDEAGAPLLAMKLVQGPSWDDLIRGDLARLSARAFLARHLPILIQVTQAVAFAHAKGVVHRDLKPSQVIVGAYGEVLLTDWGLALCTGEPAPETPVPLPGPETVSGAAGTIAYMAPEQARPGGSIGPWTDVYLLGATLYQLLTGSAPHPGTGEEALAHAQEGRFEDPAARAPDREIPPDLRTLAIRAMEREPAARVGSAREFQEALQQHLSGAQSQRDSEAAVATARELLDAETGYAGPAQALVEIARAQGLWAGNPELGPVRRRAHALYAHRALASGDLALAELQAAGIDDAPERAALLAEVDERRSAFARTRRQRRTLALTSAALLVLLLGTGAIAHRRQAMANAQLTAALLRAQGARHDAEGLVDFMVGDLKVSLEEVGRLDLLEGAAQRAIRYYDGLPAEDVSADALTRRASALLQLGDIRWYRNDLEGATRLYEQALALTEEILTREPAHAGARTQRSYAATYLGQGLRKRGDLGRALAAARRAEGWQAELVRLAPADREIREAWAVDLAHVGQTLVDLGEREEGLATLQASLDVRTQLYAEDPAIYRRTLSLGRAALAHALLPLGRLDEAEAALRTSLGLQETMLSADPRSLPLRRDHAQTRARIGALLEHRGDYPGARREWIAAEAGLRSVLDADPENANRVTDLALARAGLARVERHLRPPGARGLARQAVAALSPQVKDSPQDADLRKALALALVEAGQAGPGPGTADFALALQVLAPLGESRDGVVLERRAQALLLLGRRAEALPLVEELARRGPLPPELAARR